MDDAFSLNMDVFYPASLSILWGPGNSFKTMCNSCMHISMNNFFIKFLKQRQREKKGASTSLPQSFPSFLSQSVPTCLPPSVTQYLLLKRTIKLHSFFPLPSSFLPFILPILAFPPPPPSPPPIFSSLSFPLTSHFFLS